MHSRRPLAVVTAAVVFLTFGLTAWAQPRTPNDPDLAFIDGMIAHHQSAVAEARALAPRATRPEVQRLLADIIRTQQAEIDQLRAWRRAWYPDAPQPVDHGAHHGGPPPGEADAGQDPELAFITMMIPHHRDAVAMSREILRTTSRPELQALARNIISAQEKEIDMMERWQREWSRGAK